MMAGASQKELRRMTSAAQERINNELSKLAEQLGGYGFSGTVSVRLEVDVRKGEYIVTHEEKVYFQR